MIADKISGVYAKALLDLAQAEGKIEEFESEIEMLKSAFIADSSIWNFFKSPLLGLEEKKKVMDASFKKELSKTVYNFLGVLADRKRFDSFIEIVDAYAELANDTLNRTIVAVRSAVKMEEKQLDSLRAELERFLEKKVIFDYDTDPELLGGIVVKSGDLVMDTSIKSSLAEIKKGLLSKKILGEGYYEN